MEVGRNILGLHDSSRSAGHLRSQDSSDGIATTLQAGRSGDRIPVVARFAALVQTAPGAHPASCIMGTGSFFFCGAATQRGSWPPHS